MKKVPKITLNLEEKQIVAEKRKLKGNWTINPMPLRFFWSLIKGITFVYDDKAGKEYVLDYDNEKAWNKMFKKFKLPSIEIFDINDPKLFKYGVKIGILRPMTKKERKLKRKRYIRNINKLTLLQKI